jgi:pimeloyl-ACP methyl ester carboxylesterase
VRSDDHWTRRLAGFCFAIVGVACLLLAAPAGAKDPPLKTGAAKLNAALHCQASVRHAKREPVLLIHGTGGGGMEEWVTPVDFLKSVSDAGYPVCYVELPDKALTDVQTNAEYVVNAIRRVHKMADRPIALYGHSQGGLLARWALTYWPSLRSQVADAVSIAGTQHGTNGAAAAALVDALCRNPGCPPAFWQQRIGSSLERALNNGRDETPGPTAWTTVRTTGDDVVQPQSGAHPTSALRGATNILIQRVCPGRATDHIKAAFDSVSFAALIDALRHKGAARPSRFSGKVCSHPYAPGLSTAIVDAVDAAALPIITARVLAYPPAKREPPLRGYAKS